MTGRRVLVRFDERPGQEHPIHRIVVELHRSLEILDALIDIARTIGPGGGVDVLAAYLKGNKDITGVEINPLIVRNVKEDFDDYAGGLYNKPEVTIAVDEGRSYIRNSDKRYEVIQATLIDTWASTAAGAYTLTENNLYTLEAFKDYFEHLSDDGILSFTRWGTDESIRVASLAVESLKAQGANDPSRHIAVVRGKSNPNDITHFMITILVKKTPFSSLKGT